jgi:hypothetical protein
MSNDMGMYHVLLGDPAGVVWVQVVPFHSQVSALPP